MKIATRDEIHKVLSLRDVIPLMREALVAQSRGECETPMPMHIEVRERQGEIHIKSSYRDGGSFFAVKIVSGFPGNAERKLPTADGMILLASAETGAPVALLCDGGDLTDARTAAVSAMVARELGRTDTSIGILGSGVQARWQARAHAEVFPLREIWIWGRTPERVRQCRDDLANFAGGINVRIATSPADVARHARLIVTTTAARAPPSFARRHSARDAYIQRRIGFARQAGIASGNSRQRVDRAGGFVATMRAARRTAACSHCSRQGFRDWQVLRFSSKV